jgi:hypothetical protein
VTTPITVLVVDLDGVLRTWEKRPFAAVEKEHGLPVGSTAAFLSTLP